MAGTDLVGSANWAIFKQLQRDAQETFAKNVITWHRSAGAVDIWNEDNSDEVFNDLSLECLVDYNVFRTWPLTASSSTGDRDEESLVVLINYEYLGELGYLTANGNFNFNPSADRFTVEGFKYKCKGHTGSSQDQTDPLWVNLLLERENEVTNDNPVP